MKLLKREVDALISDLRRQKYAKERQEISKLEKSKPVIAEAKRLQKITLQFPERIRKECYLKTDLKYWVDKVVRITPKATEKFDNQLWEDRIILSASEVTDMKALKKKLGITI